MTDSKAEIIADAYEDSLSLANGICEHKEHAPFVAVCLTILDMEAQSEFDMQCARLSNKMKKLCRLVEETE